MGMSFRGSYTAIVTPFRNGTIDVAAYKRLLEFQIENGSAGVIPCGTTGESPTLSAEEQKRLIDLTVETVNGRIDVVPGTGSNNTAKSVEMTRYAEKAGADGVLLVTPYYNKPTQEGLFQHFTAIASATKLRCMLYNIPGRSAVGMTPETIARCFEADNIVAIKEATGDVNMVNRIRELCGITVLSGDDALTLPMLSIGAEGVVSVTSNVMPREMSSLVAAAAGGEWDEALRLHERLMPLFRGLFLETNPIGVKAALSMMGMISEEIRLPMTPLSHAHRPTLEKILRNLGLLGVGATAARKTSENTRRTVSRKKPTRKH